MRAVWSFWSKPHDAGVRTAWSSETDHLLAWALSLDCAARHYLDTALVTDTPGAELLIEQLGLSFATVSTQLDDLANADPQWWTLGKLYAYALQDRPFVHVDNDVFLWKALPDWLADAPVFCQNPEPFASYYRPEQLERALHAVGASPPPEWRWFRDRGSGQYAGCCGLFGGGRLDFIQSYAEGALNLATAPEYQVAWQHLGDKVGNMILIEQFLLAAWVEYHRADISSPFHGVQLQYLFQSQREAFTPARARELGYTHLIAGAKRNPYYRSRLNERVRRISAELHARCHILGTSKRQHAL